jgi:hypothetical protein
VTAYLILGWCGGISTALLIETILDWREDIRDERRRTPKEETK